MRLLVIGHSYVTAFAQKKYSAMKQLMPSLALKIVVPQQVPHMFMAYTFERGDGLEADEVVALPTLLPFRSPMTYLFWPHQLYVCIKGFQPDVVHIEEEPQSFVTIQTLLLAQRAAPQAAVCLFTWDNVYRPRAFPVGLLKRRLGGYSLQHCTAVICGNRDAEHLLHKQRGYQGLSWVLPQVGIDPTEHSPGPEEQLREQLGLQSAIGIGYIGRLIPEKGVLLLLEALTGLESYPWKLLLVGSGPLEHHIGTQWKQRFGDRLILIPPVLHREVPRYLRCLDIFVLASSTTPSWKEQFGLTLAQAMLAGVPAIGSTSGAIPDVLGPGGLLFEEGKVKELAKALEVLLACGKKRAEFSQGARLFALQHYTTQAVARQYLSVFEAAYEYAQHSQR